MHARRRFSARQLAEQVRTIRVLGVFALGLFLCLVAVWLIRDEAPEERSPAASARAADPLQAELVRCGAIGSLALEDPACRRAWTENRRRFFGSQAGPSADASRGEPRPTTEEQR